MTLNWLNFNHIFRQLTFISLLMIFCNSSIAGIYKWTDAEGNTYYGQQRPRNVSSEKMNVPRHAPVNTSTYKRPGLKSKNTDKSAAGDAEKQANQPETRKEKEQRLADCKKIRNNLATMESNARVRSQDEDGNLRYLSQEEKEARMAKSRNTLSKHCK